MQVLQHVRVGGSIIQDHQDTEGKALRHAILQLVHQGSPAVHMETVSHHPAAGIGISVDRQAGLFIALECKRVLSVVDQDGLQLGLPSG